MIECLLTAFWAKDVVPSAKLYYVLHFRVSSLIFFYFIESEILEQASRQIATEEQK